MTTLTLEAPTAILTFDVDAWREKVQRLARAEAGFTGDYKKALRQLSQANWDIGDCLLEGDKHLKDDAYVQAAKLTGKKQATLWRLAQVARVFPDDSRRRESLYWSHYKEVAKIKDQATRDRLLMNAENGDLSVKRLRVLVERELKPPASKSGARTVGVPFPPNAFTRITKLAKARHAMTSNLIYSIVAEYLDSKKIENELQEYEATTVKARQDFRKARKTASQGAGSEDGGSPRTNSAPNSK